MGKQKGEAGRSKNRPSSSSLAASLLPSGASTIGFGGYLGNSRIQTPPPSSSSEESTSSFSDVDSEVAQHLKRLGRKDPTTKLKALTSLCLLFKQNPGEEIAQIVPQWAFEYKRLLLDYNREVRRATHDAMTSLVTTVRKGLTPHLKSLMGPWWFSQFDPIPEVSQAAKRSLEAAFPAPERRLDALMLCVNEIFLYLDENLKLTPQIMSDKATPMDELEDMHQRVISSSLLAVATLVDILLGRKSQSQDSENITSEQKLASKSRMATMSSAENMLSVHKFFMEFFKSKNPAIRSATYSVMTSSIKHIPHAYNEGNMKTVSAAILGAFQEKDPSCHSSMWDMVLLFSRKFPDCWFSANVQKVVLSRFWQFLRHGCYGSQQLSFPALILFLESIPSKAVAGEHFILDFFQNLWAGRNPLHSSAADCLAFFKAFKECFLWALHNASRYCSCEDATNPLLGKLITNILVTLLWKDYLLVVNPKCQDEKLHQGSEGLRLSHERSMEAHNSSYPLSYVQELGKCVVEILSDISIKEFSLLSAFCTSFQKDYLEMFQKGEDSPKFHECIERTVYLFQLLDQLALRKGQTWPLHCLAGPMIASSFAMIKTIDSPDAVRLLSILVEIFGPVTIFSYLGICSKDECSANFTDDCNSEAKKEHFLQIFRDDFVPWCLHGHSRSSKEKLDLLIALVQDEYFSEQWSSIITYASSLDKFSEGDTMTSTDASRRIQVLSMLFEKVREKFNSMKANSVQKTGSLPEHWQHKLLDSTAVSIALHSPSSSIYRAQFLRVVLGGSLEEDQTCFLSREAVTIIFEGILRSLVSLLSTSSFKWASISCSSLLSCGSMDLMPREGQSFAEKFKMAQFAFEVLEGSILCLKMLGEDCMFVPCILAAIFILDWECSMASLMSEDDSSEISDPDVVLDNHSQEQFDAKLNLGMKMRAFKHKMTPSFWRCLSLNNLSRLRSILVQTVRSAVFETYSTSADGVTSLCCEWVLDLLEFTCHDEIDWQSLLDELLSDESTWTVWVAPRFQDGTRSATVQVERVHRDMHRDINELRHLQFVAFVDNLISSIGVGKVIAGLVSQTPSYAAAGPVENVPHFSSYPRAWLAAELLCTWKWQGGSALDSFLPLLSKYAKSEASSLEENVIFSIVRMLFSGALVQETNSQWIPFDAWVASDDEVENIQGPFLRALTSLLLTLFVKDGVWGKREAAVLFEHVVDRLSISANVSRSCVRILPFVMSVIIPPLLLQITEFDEANKDVFLAPWKDDLVLESILSWLQTALSFPPLGIGRTGEQDAGEWVQIILSCYPLRVTGEVGTLKVEGMRDISHSERTLLLSLFRKQRCGYDSPAALDEISSSSSCSSTLASSVPSQMILAKLTTILLGYCWQDFSEEDWNFILNNLHNWIESPVLLMEEMAEKIDDVVMNTATNSLELVIRDLEVAVQTLDPRQISISSTALLMLCLFSQLVELPEANDVETLQSIILGKWAHIKDQIMENVLRLLFATGVAEAIAASCSEKASSTVAASRLAHPQFWERVASSVVNSPSHVRNAAVKSMELWGLSKGPISCLYAIIFSSKPMSSLQFAAYRLISTEPICQMSLFKQAFLEENVIRSEESDMLSNLQSTSDESFCLADEISCLIQKPTAELLKMDLVSQDRVNVFLAWAILLSHLHSLPPPSVRREKLIQYVQDSISSTILDCIFQHIPLKMSASNLKKKDIELVAEASIAANAAKHIISASSVLLNIKTLWPLNSEQMASLAGSIYGMMIRLLPCYVSSWFTNLRDRALSSAIESFTKAWCSPSILLDELFQVKETIVADENFSVSVNKSAYEITATYKKEETGMDLVIRLPSCYPLRPVDVDCTRSLGISEVKKRKWLLSLTAFVRNQNGAIAEAIRIWKNNIDKEFLGVEECPICYSIIHTTYHTLPRLACKTCKHKYHSHCLYKWFATSHKSTCPLCQTPF